MGMGVSKIFGSESSVNFAKLNDKMKDLIMANTDEIITKIIDDEILLGVHELQRLEEVQSMVINNAKVLDLCKQNFELVKMFRQQETNCVKKLFTLEYKNPDNYKEEKFNQRIDTLSTEFIEENTKNFKEKSIVIKPKEIINEKGIQSNIQSCQNNNINKPNEKEEKNDKAEINKVNNKITIESEQQPKYLVDKYTRKYIYNATIKKKLLYSVKNFQEEFLEYMKTIGTYYAPNIFEFYDLFVIQCIDEMLNEELDANINSIDDITNLLIKNELFDLL